MAFKLSSRWSSVVVSAALLALPPAASADTCFTAFGGGVHIQFKESIVTPGYHPLMGVIFGGLVFCAGLTHWPVVGSAYTESGSIVVAYRAMTVDAASCGATDNIANLDPATLTGPLEMHNDRRKFSNTSTLTKSDCATPPPASATPPAHAAGRDPNGN